MGSDRARESYDPRKRYSGVVMQQGRVFVDADWNEAAEIARDLSEAEARDFVGPCGTPDNGYALALKSVPNKGYDRDFFIEPGTMYVGGLRVTLAEQARYSDQPDWLRAPAELKNLIPQNDHELVYLALQEQEVSAIEDPSIREVALGGPDTAQRTRVLQRVMRRKIDALDCAPAMAELRAEALAHGLKLDPDSMQAKSLSRLKVAFKDTGGGDGKCDPAAQGGYLGADNQLIRVQISATNKLLWGYDNASFLYRALAQNQTTLSIKPQPVDAFHQPRQGQAVEVLVAAAQTGDNEWVAADTGFVTTVGTAYDPDTGTIVLDDQLKGKYAPGAAEEHKPPLFLRVWEQEKPFTAGTPVDLDGTGLQVILHGGPFVPGDYWMIAARPAIEADPVLGTPGQIFPKRLLTDYQPPDGPRRWACPLAVLDWTNETDPITDCRNHFDDLVTLTRRDGCCVVTVHPRDLGGARTLQRVIDQCCQGGEATVCLMPGTYLLPEPLRLGPKHNHLTLTACHDGVVLQAGGPPAEFLDGLVVLTHADNISIRGIRFHMPLVTFASTGAKLADDKILSVDDLAHIAISIGLRTVHCANLEVRDCLFRFELGPGEGLHVLAIGMMSSSECWGLTLEGNRFLHDEQHTGDHLLVGYLLVPALVRASGDSKGGLAASLLHDALIRDNRFAGLTAAAVVGANAAGSIKVEDNTVRECGAGFVFLAGYLPFASSIVAEAGYKPVAMDAEAGPGTWMGSVADEPAVQRLFTLASTFPMPHGFVPARLRAGAMIAPTPEHQVPEMLRRVVQTTVERTMDIAATVTAKRADVATEVKPATAPSPDTAPATPPPTEKPATPSDAPRIGRKLKPVKLTTEPAAATPAAHPETAPASTPAAAPTAAPATAPAPAPAATPAPAPAAAPATAPTPAPASTAAPAPTAAPGTVPVPAPASQSATAPATAPAVAPTPQPAGAAPPAPEVKIESSARYLSAYATVSERINATYATQEPTHGLQLEMQVQGNTVDAYVRGALSLWAFLMLDLSGAHGAVTVTGNQWRSRSPQQWTAPLLTLARVSITGNIVSNDFVAPARAKKDVVVAETIVRALAVYGGKLMTGRVAITGNVIHGRCLFPPRASQALPTWQTYNALT